MQDDDILLGERRQSPPRKRVSVGKIVAGVLLVTVAAVLIAYGLRVSSNLHLCSVAKNAFATDPAVVNQIGQWQSCSILAFVHDEQGANPDLTAVLYQVEGTNGSCILLVTFLIKSDHIHSASLVTEEASIDLPMEAKLPDR